MSDTAHARPFSASFSRVLGLLLLSLWFARFFAHFGQTPIRYAHAHPHELEV